MTAPAIGQPIQGRVAFLYVGAVLPDTKEFDGPAFSRAGSMFQENLLHALRMTRGLKPDEVITFRQIPSYPRSQRLYVKSDEAQLRSGQRLKLLPFVNVTPLKQVCLGLGAGLRIAHWAMRTRRVSRRFVYLYNLSVPPALLVYLACKIFGIRLFVSLNDIEIPGVTVPGNLTNRLDFNLQKRLIPLFDGHVPVSDKIMRDFAPGAEYVRVEGGVRTELLYRLNARQPRPAHGALRTFKIMSFGALEEINGFRVLLSAFQQLGALNVDVELYIAGKGSLQPLVEECAARDKRIVYLGYLNFEEVLGLYQRADLLVNLRLTKEYNTAYFFPSKLLEYMATGIPVLTTMVGHAKDEFRDLVYFVEEESANAVASRLTEIILLPEEARASMGTAARNFIGREKTWEAQGIKVSDYILARLNS